MTNGKQSIGRMKAKSMPNQQEDSTNKRYSFDRIDMRDAPITEHVYGRDIEVGTLEQWIQDDHCRVVALVGLGGIGKTTLAELVTKHIKDHFDYVFWYSLLHAPPPSIFLERCIRFLSNQEEIFLPSSIDDQIQLLLEYMQKYRCLLVLDNVDTILQSKLRVGVYREGYDEYGQLLRHFSKGQHQSCLLLTSRERPQEIAYEANTSQVRILELFGIGSREGQKLLRDRGLFGSDDAFSQLSKLYSGNPLSLQLIAKYIRDLFGGDVSAFLKEEETVVHNVYNLLESHFNRLSTFERETLYWIMVEREPVTLDSLRENISRQVTKREVLEALESLRERYMIEIIGRGTAHFTLQPVIMEYTTDKFVEQIVNEIGSDQLSLFKSHALIKAQAKDYIRDIQRRVVLAPLAGQLLNMFGKAGIEEKCKRFLSQERSSSSQLLSYAAGNALNLLTQLSSDLQGYDFSYLTVRQAFLQSVILHNVNFAHAYFKQTIFTDTFGGILSVAFSLDGELLASGGTDQTIRLWDADTGQCLSVLHGHSNRVMFVAFSADGKLLASGSDDQTIRLWEVSTGQCLTILHSQSNRVRALAFSVDGKLLASGSDDQLVRLWEVSTGQCIHTLTGHNNRVMAVALSRDGKLLASSSADQTIKLWEVSTGQCLSTLQGHSHRIRSVNFSPNGKLLASGSDDQTIKLWEVSAGQCLSTLQGHNNWVMSVAFSADGKVLASGSKDQTIRLWDIEAMQCFSVLRGHSNRVMSVVFNSDSTIVASGSEDQTIKLWEVSTGQCLSNLFGHNSRVMSVAFSPNGMMLASGSDDQIVQLWEASTGRNLGSLRGHSNWVTTVAFSPDGMILASGSEDQTVRLWEVQNKQYLFALQGHSSGVRSIAFSPDCTTLASGSDDQKIQLWNVKSRQHLKSLYGHTSRVLTVAFNGNGNLLASGSEDQAIRLWDSHTGQCLSILRGHSNRVTSIAFSPDGQLLASGGADQIIYLWDLNTREHIYALHGHGNRVKSVAFSPDGQLLASGGDDQVIKLWDIKTGQCLSTIQAHNSSIRALAFSPDGQFLTSGSDDGTIKLWDVPTGKCLRILKSDRPYERMNITQTSGLTEAQKATLKELGAVEIPENDLTAVFQPSIATPPSRREHIFISYSHKDKRWMEKLQTMLTPLVRREIIRIWADTQIQPGGDWRKEISDALDSAKVAVLLVTPDFLASDFIARHELPPLLRAAEKDGLTILWIAVSASLYKFTEVDAFQPLNDPDLPLDGLSSADRNKELVQISERIKRVVGS